MNKTIQELVADTTMYAEVVKGMSKPQKSLPSKFFYDKRGSELFEAICEVGEYYLTRTELSIIQENIDEISTLLGPHVQLIELGSGSSRKTRILLDNLEGLHSYVPVDISEKFLVEVTDKLKGEYPGLTILPVAADYTRRFSLPKVSAAVSKIAYFPGSTIGNFTLEQARAFMEFIAEMVDQDGGLLIGFDLKKDIKILENAYNDSEGITAAFNKNILVRLNRELGANFNLEQFQHQAFFNKEVSKMEMHLVSLSEQTVRINGTDFHLAKGESIHTENSHKYSLDDFRELTLPFFESVNTWTDQEKKFCVQFLS